MSSTFLRDKAIDAGAFLIRKLEGFIAQGSKVGNTEFFDVESFPWAKDIECDWRLIRAELDKVLEDQESVPPFQEISRDQRHLTNDDRWKTYFFYAYSFKAERNCTQCPETDRLLQKIPGMTTAFYSILAPGKHLPDHRGTFKGILRYHLGLLIPEPQDQCGIRVGSQTRSWEEGKSLIFDDTYRHEAWNHTEHTRAVLFVDFVRPLRFPASAINSLILGAIKKSPFVKDGISNYRAWEAKLDQP